MQGSILSEGSINNRRNHNAIIPIPPSEFPSEASRLARQHHSDHRRISETILRGERSIYADMANQRLNDFQRILQVVDSAPSLVTPEVPSIDNKKEFSKLLLDIESYIDRSQSIVPMTILSLNTQNLLTIPEKGKRIIRVPLTQKSVRIEIMYPPTKEGTKSIVGSTEALAKAIKILISYGPPDPSGLFLLDCPSDVFKSSAFKSGRSLPGACGRQILFQEEPSRNPLFEDYSSFERPHALSTLVSAADALVSNPNSISPMLMIMVSAPAGLNILVSAFGFDCTSGMITSSSLNDEKGSSGACANQSSAVTNSCVPKWKRKIEKLKKDSTTLIKIEEALNLAQGKKHAKFHLPVIRKRRTALKTKDMQLQQSIGAESDSETKTKITDNEENFFNVIKSNNVQDGNDDNDYEDYYSDDGDEWNKRIAENAVLVSHLSRSVQNELIRERSLNRDRKIHTTRLQCQSNMAAKLDSILRRNKQRQDRVTAKAQAILEERSALHLADVACVWRSKLCAMGSFFELLGIVRAGQTAAVLNEVRIDSAKKIQRAYLRHLTAKRAQLLRSNVVKARAGILGMVRHLIVAERHDASDIIVGFLRSIMNLQARVGENIIELANSGANALIDCHRGQSRSHAGSHMRLFYSRILLIQTKWRELLARRQARVSAYLILWRQAETYIVAKSDINSAVYLVANGALSLQKHPELATTQFYSTALNELSKASSSAYLEEAIIRQNIHLIEDKVESGAGKPANLTGRVGSSKSGVTANAGNTKKNKKVSLVGDVNHHTEDNGATGPTQVPSHLIHDACLRIVNSLKNINGTGNISFPSVENFVLPESLVRKRLNAFVKKQQQLRIQQKKFSDQISSRHEKMKQTIVEIFDFDDDSGRVFKANYDGFVKMIETLRAACATIMQKRKMK